MARQMVAHLEYSLDDVKFHRERLRCTRHRVGSDLRRSPPTALVARAKSGKFEGADSVLGPPAPQSESNTSVDMGEAPESHL